MFGILVGSGQLESDMLEQYEAVGELSLEGKMRKVNGALSIAMSAAKQAGIRGLLVPAENAREVAVVEGLDIIQVSSLSEAFGFLSGKLQIEPIPSRLHEIFEAFSKYEVDFSDVRGQEMSKRALTIAAAGAHNLLILGPPGSGKTMLAKRFPSILATLSTTDSIETTRIYSAFGAIATWTTAHGSTSLSVTSSHHLRPRTCGWW